MNVHDDMTDNEVLRAAADSLSAIPLASPPDVQAIVDRGRARRTRRHDALAGLSVAGVAGGTALVLGLTGVLGPARAPGTIRTASFTLASNSNGTATLTISPAELLDSAALQRDLAQYGIPAKVTTGSLCTSNPAPAGFSQVVSTNPSGEATLTPVAQPTMMIDPSAIPRAPSSASATSSSPRASSPTSSRPTSCSSTAVHTPAAAPRLTQTACLTATASLTASGCFTGAPVQLGRDRSASAVDFRYCAGPPPDCRRGRLSV